MLHRSKREIFLVCLLLEAMIAGGCDKKGDKGMDSGTNGEVTLDYVTGLQGTGNVRTGVPIVFYFRLYNNTGETIIGLTHGFRIYSPDGAEWDTAFGFDAGGITYEMFDLSFFGLPFSATGSKADTIGFGGVRVNTAATGIPDGFDDVVFAVQIGPINDSYHGHRICVDSSWFRPSNPWMWSTDGGTIYPGWDGPHCFQIVSPP
jgi:hypothetical protein